MIKSYMYKTYTVNSTNKRYYRYKGYGIGSLFDLFNLEFFVNLSVSIDTGSSLDKMFFFQALFMQLFYMPNVVVSSSLVKKENNI